MVKGEIAVKWKKELIVLINVLLCSFAVLTGCEDIAIEDDFKFEEAIEHILTDREKLEKENAQLKEKYNKALSDLAEGTHKRIVKGAEDGTNN